MSFSSVSTEVKSWINFNGTGTPAIRASKNVSSITDHGTGDYTINFTTALTDADYAVAGSSAKTATLDTGEWNRGTTLLSQTLSSGSFRIITSQLWTTTREDFAINTLIVTR